MRNHFIIIIMASIGFTQKINLNNDDLNKMHALNLSIEQLNEIIEYRQRVGTIHDIYELLTIPNISIEDIHSIRSYITIEVNQKSTFEKDMQKASYKLGRWISNEGNSEGLSETWLDRFYEPQNINDMTYDDLMLLPNLSPIDVTAVLKQKKRGYINGNFELKNSPGISYWGYKNLIDFVRFENINNDKKNIHFRFNTLIRSMPITSNPEELYKFSITYENNLKIGLTYHKQMGQPDSIFTFKKFVQTDNLKLFNKLTINRIILGNYTASFGQGVLFESSDNFSPRRTGFGFSKRAEGIHGDLTRSSQYVLYGIAMQASYENIRATLFTSRHPRDAIINGDGSFTSLIVMQPRLPLGETGEITHPLVNSLNEMTWGTNIRFSPMIGTNIGFTFFESLYDRPHIPQIINTITGGDDDLEPELHICGDDDDNCLGDDYDDYSGDAYYLNYITNSADSEVAAMDASIAKSELWNEAQSFFRARGFNFSTVINNISIQGEYGEMLKDQKLFLFGRSPSAFVLSTYAQFDNLNLLVLYRNYDLHYDNPYQRSFSNYQRFKTSILEDVYWLEDPIFSFLYSGNPQPQSEEGVFISSRYQFHRSMVTTLNWDTWNRKADNAKYYRTVASLDWRPAFNFRIKIRQKWQARGHFNIQNPSPFYSRETRIQARLRMSKYNQFEILYSNGHTTFSPRPRLTDNPLGGEMMVGNIGSPDKTIGFNISHNFDNNFSIKSGVLYIHGFLWYFEDTDFRVFNSENGAIHTWASTDMKLSSLFRVMFKISRTKDAISTRIVEGQTLYGNWTKNPQISNEEVDYRLQINYAL